MSTPQLERLHAHCHRLRLYRVEAELTTLLEQAAKREVAYADFLDEVLGLEVRAKAEKHLAMRTAMARFPSTRPSRPSTSNSSRRSTRR
jgi:DNA replication protein DnaC